MPKYINIRQGGSFSQGKFYREGETALFTKEYGKKKPKSWMLFSEYEEREERIREASALNESSEEKVLRLEKELAAAKKQNSTVKKQDEKLLDAKPDYYAELKRAKELGYDGPAGKAAVFAWLDEQSKEKAEEKTEAKTEE